MVDSLLILRQLITSNFNSKVMKKVGGTNTAFYEEERDIMAKTTSPWLTKLDYAFQVGEE